MILYSNNLLTNKHSICILFLRVEQCMCYPWNMPKPKGLQLPLCTYFGNECISKKVSNKTYKMESCDCLPSCSDINYKYVIDSIRKFTPDEVESLCLTSKPHDAVVWNGEKAIFNITRMADVSKTIGDHSWEKCHDYVMRGYARVTVKMADSTYLRRSQSIPMSFLDKLGVIGGTIGILTGFSFISLFELGHWVVITLIKFFKSSVEPEEEEPVQKQFKEMKKENDFMKAEIAKLKEFLMKKEHMPPPDEPSKTMVVTETQ